MYLLTLQSPRRGQNPAGNRRGGVSANLQKALFLRVCCTEPQKTGGKQSTLTYDTPRSLSLFCHKVVFIKLTAIFPPHTLPPQVHPQNLHGFEWTCSPPLSLLLRNFCSLFPLVPGMKSDKD